MRMRAFRNNPSNAGISKRGGTVNPETTSSVSSKQEPSSFSEPGDGAQLSRLSSVLNGLENGAMVMRRHVVQAMRAVRSGTYYVDPLKLSKRIVGEAMGSA
jgi:hypothetical protein